MEIENTSYVLKLQNYINNRCGNRFTILKCLNKGRDTQSSLVLCQCNVCGKKFIRNIKKITYNFNKLGNECCFKFRAMNEYLSINETSQIMVDNTFGIGYFTIIKCTNEVIIYNNLKIKECRFLIKCEKCGKTFERVLGTFLKFDTSKECCPNIIRTLGDKSDINVVQNRLDNIFGTGVYKVIKYTDINDITITYSHFLIECLKCKKRFITSLLSLSKFDNSIKCCPVKIKVDPIIIAQEKVDDAFGKGIYTVLECKEFKKGVLSSKFTYRCEKCKKIFDRELNSFIKIFDNSKQCCPNNIDTTYLNKNISIKERVQNKFDNKFGKGTYIVLECNTKNGLCEAHVTIKCSKCGKIFKSMYYKLLKFDNSKKCCPNVKLIFNNKDLSFEEKAQLKCDDYFGKGIYKIIKCIKYGKNFQVSKYTIECQECKRIFDIQLGNLFNNKFNIDKQCCPTTRNIVMRKYNTRKLKDSSIQQSSLKFEDLFQMGVIDNYE